MDEAFYRNKWIAGLLLPGIGLVWGASSLASGEIIIPIRQYESLPLYYHILLHGWSAIFMAAGVISASLAAHFNAFWNSYPQCKPFSSRLSFGAGWAAAGLFATAIVVWVGQLLIELVAG